MPSGSIDRESADTRYGPGCRAQGGQPEIDPPTNRMLAHTAKPLIHTIFGILSELISTTATASTNAIAQNKNSEDRFAISQPLEVSRNTCMIGCATTINARTSAAALFR